MLPYTTTKHAVVGLSTALRAEAASQGVRVSVLCPAFVDTPMLDEMYAAPPSLAGGVRARVRLTQPTFLTADVVARRAVDGLAANKAVIPGGFLQLQASGHRRLNDRAARRNPESTPS
jgi:short-subunit dehydrogenase